MLGFDSLLLHSICHELLLGALRADDVFPVCDESFADHTALARGADETIVVPVTTLKRYEAGSANASNGFAAGSTTLGEEFAEAVGTIRFVIPRCEPLAGKRLLTMGASEALPVPRVITISDSALSDDLIALDTLGGELFFITFGTVDVVLLWDERFGANGVFARAADETFLVPLTGLVLHLFHTCFEHIATSIASCGKLGVIAWATIDPVSLRAELFVDEAASAFVAQEASLMPVLLFV